ncbi:MAG: CRISPR system precrRNA processing endoribonuclease RAMP protein Cas6 [Candidatus Nezhaarchaeota archaeon]|nr:CRISPR system precrRNA processing endoribonuclease RAMP protein Cas6 [Candidatus Nezhaarchaeota archaeon]
MSCGEAMVTQAVMQLRSYGDVGVRSTTFIGQLSRAVFYTMLGSFREEMARAIHERKDKPAPFSSKPPFIESGGEPQVLYTKIPVNTTFYLEFDILEEGLAEVFKEVLLKAAPSTVTLGPSQCVVMRLSVRDVPEDYLLNVETHKKFSIRFVTPTFFRIHIPRALRKTVSVRVLPLPDPFHLLVNLYNLWNSYFKHKIKEEYLEWLQQQPVLISRVKDLNTHYYVDEARGTVTIGFTGTTYYTLADDVYDEEMAKATHQLLRLAEFSNVGGGRTAGFGWIRVKYWG